MSEQTTLAPDIERAAVTLLSKAARYAPELEAYIERICKEPDFRELPADWWGQVIDHDNTYPPFFPDDPDANHNYTRFAHILDDAAARLAYEIVQYRREGRPTGDVYRDAATVYDIGVQTSLAAAVVAFHHAIVNAWAMFVKPWSTR